MPKPTDSPRPVDAGGREIRGGFTVQTPTGDLRLVGAYCRQARELGARYLIITWPPGRDLLDVASDQVMILDASAVTVVEPPAGHPSAQGTDEILHRLRELVASAPGGTFTEPQPEWVALFDELDYRMSRRAYGAPSQWRDR